jgi:4,4'-diaponeurosporenoate glycosyltransferase
LTLDLIIRLTFFIFGFWLLWKIPYCGDKKKSEKIKTTDQNESHIKYPKISVIIPARNEETNLKLLLDSLKLQELKPFEVIVVDDQSEDRTSEVARSDDAILIRIESLSEGWNGKSWACYNGAKYAKGDFFLFLDADTVLHREGIKNIYNCYLRNNAVITVQPYHFIKEPYENFSSYFNLILMAAMNAFTPFQRLLKPIGVFGPCLFCSRENYFMVNGHQGVSKSIIEDLDFGKNLMRKKIPIRNYGGMNTINFRMYPGGMKGLINGWTKSMGIGAKSTPIYLLIMIVAWISANFSPIFFLAKGIYLNDNWLLLAGVMLYAALSLQINWMLRRIGNFSFWVPVFYLIPLLFFITIFVRSLYKVFVARSIEWKGRVIKVNRKR